MEEIKYSVVIPSYNSNKSIRKCLDSVSSQDLPHKFEIIVVDSSSDDTAIIIKNEYPNVRLIKLENRTDQGKARNIGVGRACGEVIFFIDSDCVAQPDWMKSLLSALEMGFSAAGGPITNGNPETSVSWAGYFFEFNDLLPSRKGGPVEHVASGNSCYKKEVFLKYGGFPSGLKFAVEDIMYNWFLTREGVKMYHEPKAAVAHFYREKVSSYIKHQHKLARGTVHMLSNTHAAGWWIAKYPILSLPVLPILPFIKFVRINSHIIKFKPSLYLQNPLIVPLIILGLAAWLCGFAQELYFGEDVSRHMQAAIHKGES